MPSSTPAVSKYTDTDGTTFLSAGKGDMIVWASKDGQFGFAKATFGKDKSITIKLDYNEQNMPKEQTSTSFRLLQILHYLLLPRHRGMKIRVV